METRQLVIGAALVLGIAAPASGQQGLLAGTVLSPSGAGVPGVVITVWHPEDAHVRVAVTDSRGEYVVKDMDESTAYRVEISHPQFRTTELRGRPAEIRAQEVVTLEPRRHLIWRLLWPW